MSMYVTSTETPLFWETLAERRTYSTLASLTLSWPGQIPEPEPTHQPGCKDPYYDKPAWCDCNNLTRADACDCDGSGCTWCLDAPAREYEPAARVVYVDFIEVEPCHPACGCFICNGGLGLCPCDGTGCEWCMPF